MLADRPLLRAYLTPADAIWKWTARKYDVRVLGSQVEWDPSVTIAHVSAENESPAMGEPGKIRVNPLPPNYKGDSAAFERLWCSVVFELHNIEFAGRYERIAKEVVNGELSEEQYIGSMVTIEFKAIQQTRRWYVEVFLPHAKKYQLDTNPLIWHCTSWDTAESMVARYTDKNSYPWEPYHRYYEELKAVGTEVRSDQDTP